MHVLLGLYRGDGVRLSELRRRVGAASPPKGIVDRRDQLISFCGEFLVRRTIGHRTDFGGLFFLRPVTSSIMDARGTGQLIDQQTRTAAIPGLTFSESEYEMAAADWHYHENGIFTFVTQGALRLGNRREVYDCPADTLLFHSWQEPHYNAKPAGATRGFQVSVDHTWREKYDLQPGRLPGATKVDSPDVRLSFYRLFQEVRRFDDDSELAIEGLLLETFQLMQPAPRLPMRGTPAWVARVRAILHETTDETISLQNLARAADVHWAHLSRDFRRYFRCNFGEYLRQIRVERSLPLLRRGELTLAEIALLCGFADQSHFTRIFRQHLRITPRQFQRLMQ